MQGPTRSPSGSPVGSPTVTTGSPMQSPSNTGSCVDEPTPTSTVLDTNTLIEFVGSSRAAENPSDAVDGTTSKFTIDNDPFKSLAPGLIAIPSCSLSIVKGIRFYTSSSAKWYDPTTYVLEGRSDENDEWQAIAKGEVSMPRGRNSDGLEINSSFAAGDDSYRHDELKFSENEEVYSQYRVLFPSTRGDEDSVILAELELPGILIPGSNAPTHLITDAPTPKITDTPTPKITDAPTPEITDVPSFMMSSAPSKSPTKSPSASPSVTPTASENICERLGKSACKKVKESCVFGKSKIFGACAPKKSKYKHDCSQYTDETSCSADENHDGLCKFDGVCVHICDDLSKKPCTKTKNIFDGKKTCKLPKFKNPCKGCMPKTTCA